MSDEPPTKPLGKELFLVPINPHYPDWLINAKTTITVVAKQTSGRLQMRGVGLNKTGEQDPQSLLAIKESELGNAPFLFWTLYWLKPGKVIESPQMAETVFERFIDFTRNIAGGAGLIVGDPIMIEVIAAMANNTWPPKEPSGCSLIKIGVSISDKPTYVTRILDPSADPQRRLPGF
ncbi:hypothetical protein EPO17_02695 [Patescibacteria group bacterium]|nr:MAG: hypothetical protein EPO17_02695 [Patescibacteria group bacterium]